MVNDGNLGKNDKPLRLLIFYLKTQLIPIYIFKIYGSELHCELAGLSQGAGTMRVISSVMTVNYSCVLVLYFSRRCLGSGFSTFLFRYFIQLV